jgi:EAL domain-containing protein (putative c-di-GMP-specific phosphodiesterase class I)
MDEALKRRQQLDVALSQAIEAGALRLEYQPQVYLGSGEIIGVEALVRWRDTALGEVRPDVFIPAAEESGQIVELGRFVLNRACRDAARWSDWGKISVNVSPIQFELSDLVEDVRQALVASKLPPERLELEITEGTFISNSPFIEPSLESLRDIGVSIAVDDFGTGYSTLSYLGRLPVDKIKIDQSFVGRLPSDPEAFAIVKTVVALSQALGKAVVAEGVETSDQASALSLLGCEFAQGYYFGQAMLESEAQTIFDKGGRAPARSAKRALRKSKQASA